MSVTRHDPVLAIAIEPVMVKIAKPVTSKGYAGVPLGEKRVTPNTEKCKGARTTAGPGRVDASHDGCPEAFPGASDTSGNMQVTSRSDAPRRSVDWREQPREFEAGRTMSRAGTDSDDRSWLDERLPEYQESLTYLTPPSRELVASGQLAEQGCRIRADPLFGDQAVLDAIELVADVVDCPAGGGNALERSGVGAVKCQAYRNAVLGRDHILEVYFEVRKRALHHFVPLLPGLAPADWLWCFCEMHHQVRRCHCEQPAGVAGVECLDRFTNERRVRLD